MNNNFNFNSSSKREKIKRVSKKIIIKEQDILIKVNFSTILLLTIKIETSNSNEHSSENNV